MDDELRRERHEQFQTFRLIDWIMAIKSAVMLAMLVIPGAYATRQVTRRADCLYNLMNLGKAFQNYHANQGCLPPSGRWDVREPATRAEWSDLSKLTAANAATMRYSWALELMPYLDHSDISDQWDFSDQLKEPVKPTAIGGGFYWLSNTPKLPNGGNTMLAGTTIRVLTCSADPTTQPGKGNLSYVVNGGFHYDWRMTHAADGSGGTVLGEDPVARRFRENLRRMGAFSLESGDSPKENRITWKSFVDGQTTTVLMTENINAGVGAAWEEESPGFPSNWACPHPWNTSFFVNGFASGCDVTPANDSGYRFDRANARGRNAPPRVPAGGQVGINGSLSGGDEG
ncbi:MAG TPA: DUF1559 domain-containing protein, partial [Planctomycetia bacterium]|nr:DUF1559 domain-containing protein [Planctomycetia bacterium]